MHIKNQKDFWAGVMFILFGGFFAGFGTQYTFGTAARMGPGYFPTVLGILLIVLGLVVAVTGLSKNNTEEKVAKFAWDVLGLIIGSVVLFGVLLNPLGLIGSLLVLILVSSYASHEHTWKASLGNSVVLISLCMFVFVYALKLQFQLWPIFLRS
ncbi:MAG: tripartite tricarboxylate transporter TctB family protein [Lacisediminimonas sp.]|nr:tripartite tricarboxylate transporter TctB family protein [Lacisediminimonas sp.]